MRADVLLRWLDAGLLEGSTKDRIEDLRIDERPVRDLVGDEQRAGCPAPAVPDVVDDRLASVLRQRHAVVPLAFATDQDRAGSPIDVIELDRDDLRRTQTEAGENQQHRIVAASDRVGRPGRIGPSVDLLRLQRSWKVGVARPGDARKTAGQIALGLAAPEQEAEQAAQMRRGSPVTVGLRSTHHLAEERHDIAWGDVIQIAERCAEAERHEAVQEARAVIDRCLGQAPLLTKIDLVLRSQTFEFRRHLLWRFGWFGNIGLDKSIDEAIEAKPLISACVEMHAIENCSTHLCKCMADELSRFESAPRDLLAKQGRRSAVDSQRAARVALIAQVLQESFTMRLQPFCRYRHRLCLALRHGRPLRWMEIRTYRRARPARNRRRTGLWVTSDYADAVRYG